VAARAGISKKDFHKIFADDEQCYRAAFEESLSRLSRVIEQAAERENAWLERVRAGLVALLGFFDDEPSPARLLVVDTPLGAAVTFRCRQRLHELLAGLLNRDSGVTSRDTARATRVSAVSATLASELIVGGVLSVIRTTMLEGDERKLVELAPSLMAFIVAPYLGQAAAQAELEGRPSRAGEAPAAEPGIARAQTAHRAAELPIRATYRTTLVLRAIEQAPYSNNREVAQAAGLIDEGQTSKLLARLERRGVIENVGVGAARGEPNAWLLTASGRRTVELLAGGEARGAARRTSSHARGLP
jgi:AcrR family transcriptional regulator